MTFKCAGEGAWVKRWKGKLTRRIQKKEKKRNNELRTDHYERTGQCAVCETPQPAEWASRHSVPALSAYKLAPNKVDDKQTVQIEQNAPTSSSFESRREKGEGDNRRSFKQKIEEVVSGTQKSKEKQKNKWRWIYEEEEEAKGNEANTVFGL